MEFEVIQKNTTPSMIVEQIIKALEEGKLKPGEKLPPERDLAKIFGVGRSSVREAIRVLVVMGYLETIQGKGTFVSKDTPLEKHDDLNLEDIFAASPMFDLMEARHILELQAVKLAAERADMKHLRKMQKAVAKMEQSGDNIKTFYEADLAFHTALAEASSNVFIGQMIKILFKQISRYNSKFMATSYETKERTIVTAKKIVELIGQGQGEEAALCMAQHLGEVDTSLKGIVLKKEKRGDEPEPPAAGPKR